MKNYLAITAISAVALMATGAFAQDSTTVVHQDENGAVSSKKVVHHANGSKTVIKKNADMTKKVHTSADGDKTVVVKTNQ